MVAVPKATSLDVLHDIETVLSDWAALELAPWHAMDLPPAALERELRDVVSRHTSMSLLRVENGVASLDPEREREQPNLADPRDPMGLRSIAYIDHLNQAFEAYGAVGSGLLALYLDDIFPTGISAPIFCFQKRRGGRSLLLPDVDFMNWDFYAGVGDELTDRSRFDEKQDAAIFVGSTTGDLPLTATHVAELRNNRLRAAVRFRDSDRVVFHLPQIVQCDRAETEQMIHALGVTGRTWTWQEQLRFRYLLSMDGNGATCSRVVLALRSNSVLFKYNSPYQLFYFKGLAPWRHYVPIIADRDVQDLLNDSSRLRATFDEISHAATEFARTYLTRLSVLRYSAEIVNRYLMKFGSAQPLRPGGHRLLVDLQADLAAIGRRWALPGAWIAPTSEAGTIQSYRLVTSGACSAGLLSYSGFDSSGEETEAVADGGLCRLGGGGMLHGVRITMRSDRRIGQRLRYRARFADGHVTKTVDSGTALRRPAALVDLQVQLVPERRFGRYPELDDGIQVAPNTASAARSISSS